MPQYTYHCENCDHQFDQYQSFQEDPLVTCPQCGQPALLKVYKPALVVFKGKGFYVTDNGSSKRTLDTPDHKEKEKSGENGKSETKAEDKKEKKDAKKEKKKKAKAKKETA